MPERPWQDSLQNSLGVYLPSILGGVAILLVGWIIALIAANATRRALASIGTNQRLGAHTQTSVDFQDIAGRVVFWVIMLLALLGMFSVLQVQGVSGPLSTLATSVMVFLPRLLLAVGLAVVAWLVATVVRTLVNRTLSKTRMDERLAQGADLKPISQSMGNVAYWLVLLLFLPAIVGALQIEGLMTPLTGMTSSLLGMLPNIFAAVIIGGVGWLIAKAVRGLVSNLLAATGIDRWSERHPDTRGLKLSDLGGTLAFVMVIVPALIAALDALRITAISAPLTRMLSIFFDAIPNLLAAAAILILAWFIGRFVASLVERLLSDLGFDRLPSRLGLGHAFRDPDVVPPSERTGSDALMATTTLERAAESQGAFQPVDAMAQPPVGVTTTAASADVRSGGTLSAFAGKLALFFVMLFATVEAASLLGFAGINALLQQFIDFGAAVLLGLVILGVGWWLADVAGRAVERANPQSRGLARLARFSILGLVTAMGLRAMGVADDIVNLAFGLVLGAIAVAVALAFGLGGRDAAGKVTQRWADEYLRRRPPSEP
ncbi:mechanosensitive ion channel [Cognatilysobacter lacus]|uniref:Small-conductance mechanosensitive channel n=1 Tax=Cognatilysobacter lacus TaxID=1643323 RepID=A0A5D8Z7K2_9GAMM|nr:mechanosensitive ion channel [Lysobacter lacus]TZF90915.1 mechanosensitive ion channel [Lysobacter lacus]